MWFLKLTDRDILNIASVAICVYNIFLLSEKLVLILSTNALVHTWLIRKVLSLIYSLVVIFF